MTERLGKYQILERIGRGGMGIVLKAHDTVLDRVVALKVIAPEIEVTQELRTRFFREAQACARLSHPNIVTVYDLGEIDGRLFIVMEFLDGEELRQVIAQPRSMSLEQKLALMMQVCDGLGYAHQHGVVHRDIKPGNIFLLRDGGVKILDFGVARITSADAGLTRTGLIMGTLRYMAPEQARGRADHRSDIFSAGAVFYELLAHRPAFPGEDPMEILEALRSQDPPRVSDLDPNVPAALGDLIARALWKDPARRIQDLADVRRELDSIRRELPRAAREPGHLPDGAPRHPAEKAPGEAGPPVLDDATLAVDVAATRASPLLTPAPVVAHAQGRQATGSVPAWAPQSGDTEATVLGAPPSTPSAPASWARASRRTLVERPLRWAIPIGGTVVLVGAAALLTLGPQRERRAPGAPPPSIDRASIDEVQPRAAAARVGAEPAATEATARPTTGIATPPSARPAEPDRRLQLQLAEELRDRAATARLEAERAAADRGAPDVMAAARDKEAQGRAALQGQDFGAAAQALRAAETDYREALERTARAQEIERGRTLEDTRRAAAQSRVRAEGTDAATLAPELWQAASDQWSQAEAFSGRGDTAQALRAFRGAGQLYGKAAERARAVKDVRTLVETAKSRRAAAVKAGADMLAKEIFDAGSAKLAEGDSRARAQNWTAASRAYREAVERYGVAEQRVRDIGRLRLEAEATKERREAAMRVGAERLARELFEAAAGQHVEADRLARGPDVVAAIPVYRDAAERYRAAEQRARQTTSPPASPRP